MRPRCACLLLVAVLGCDHSSPLGTFTRNDLPKWKTDCDAPIVEEGPRDLPALNPPLRDGGPAFERAVRRYRCPPPGWAVYTDDDNRVVGLCVDDEIRYPVYGEKDWQEVAAGKRPATERVSEIDRARDLITARWGDKLAGDMLKGISGDKCSRDSERVAHGMTRWGAGQFIYLDAERIYSRSMCCWEVQKD